MLPSSDPLPHHADAEIAEDALADLSANQLGAETDLVSAGDTLTSFLASYRAQPDGQSLENWLAAEFAKYPSLWDERESAEAAAADVVASITYANEAKASLAEHLDRGQSRANWIAAKMEKAATAQATLKVGDYATTIDKALEQANAENWRVLLRQDGGISQCLNLDGFIAEQHHVGTFNVDAAAKGSAYRARVLEPGPGEAYGKNSVDIGIYDGNGKLVRRYQVKYGADGNATTTLFEKGDYRGQRKLVPEGQGDAVQGSSETIEIDGVTSAPLSKEEAKELQRRAQEELEARQYDWNQASRIDIAKQLGKQALIGACIAAALQGARVLGRRVWNRLTGKANAPLNEDLKEFFDSSLTSCGHVGLQVAVSGALVVAIKSGWLGKALKNTPAGRIANIAFVALENAKVLFKLGKGEITREQALDAMGNVTVTCVLSLAASAAGAELGAAIGCVFGPVGAVVGGFIGGLAAGMAGGAIADKVYQGGKTVARAALDMAKSVHAAVTDGAKAMARSVSSVFSGLSSLLA
jgi:hypothetical protein